MRTLIDWMDKYLINTVKEIRLIDVIDILILAFVFYYIYAFIRDRRAGKLAVGLLVIMSI